MVVYGYCDIGDVIVNVDCRVDCDTKVFDMIGICWLSMMKSSGVVGVGLLLRGKRKYFFCFERVES